MLFKGISGVIAMVMKLRVRELKMRKGFRVGVRRGAVSVSVAGLVASTMCAKNQWRKSFLEAFTLLEMPLPGFGRTGQNCGVIPGGVWELVVDI